MRRFGVLLASAALVVLLALFFSIGSHGSNEAQAQEVIEKRPNILFILTDDQPESTFTPEIMPYTFGHVVEPGMRFENGAVTTSLCCPMRASTLRGQYAHNTGVLSNEGPSGGFEAFKAKGYGSDNLGVWMQEAGYRTGFFGKVMNRYGISQPRYRLQGWDYWYGYQGGPASKVPINVNGRIHHSTKDASVDIASKANGFITQDSEEPFFAYVAVKAPHAPFDIPERYDRKKGLPTALEPKPSFNEADVSDKAPETRWKPLSGKQKAYERWAHAKRVKASYAVDQIVVRRLMNSLAAKGELDNTYVIFMSDNGMMEGAHRMSSKALPYEEAHQVPFAIVGPGVQSTDSEALAANIDIRYRSDPAGYRGRSHERALRRRDVAPDP
jgi:N-acetylglucosamine-6-sulfatase